MEDLKKSLEKDKSEKQLLFKCSQCNKMLDLSGKIFYCKNCKSNFCPDCLKGHNEVFFDHEVHETKEDLEYGSQENDKNSLLANPDLDLDDRGVFSDNKLPQVGQSESDKKLNELNILFHETITSIEENFNEEICKIKTKISNDENNINSDNKIIVNNIDLDFNIEKLKYLPPMERLQRIMEIINLKK